MVLYIVSVVLIQILIVHGLTIKEDFESKPFVTIWNAPLLKCERQFGVRLNLSYFDIVANSGDYFEGDEVVIFYKGKLGLYPWIDNVGTYINGGLPQLANLTAHLQKTTSDLDTLVPNTSFSGLAVIDWESWRPIFDRNSYNDVMKIYQKESENLIRNDHPDWSDGKIENEARIEFEKAARQFMQTTLEVCKRLRPRGYWGFYGFPSCYNYEKGQRTCSDTTQYYNDQLQWLFGSSTAITPSIYLSESMGDHEDRYNRVYGDLRETLRVRYYHGNQYTPLIAYSLFRYGDTGNFYDQTDLQSTIKQAADVGYNGVALWGSSNSFETREDCQATRDYIDTTLGPFVLALSEQVNQCSRNLCSGHGRCVRNVNRPIPYTTYRILIKLFRLVNLNHTHYLRHFLFRLWTRSDWFRDVDLTQCSCFRGWDGDKCQIPNISMI